MCDKFAKAYDENYNMPELINQKQALHYYDKACALGVGCESLAHIYLFCCRIVGGDEVKPDSAKAKRYFTKACDNGGDDYNGSVSCRIKRMSPKEFENLDESIFN